MITENEIVSVVISHGTTQFPTPTIKKEYSLKIFKTYGTLTYSDENNSFDLKLPQGLRNDILQCINAISYTPMTGKYSMLDEIPKSIRITLPHETLMISGSLASLSGYDELFRLITLVSRPHIIEL